jgi:hypothetical protein
MKLSHGTVLAFIGWYLMMPPMAADLRPDCTQNAAPGSSVLFLSLLTGTSPRQFELGGCNHLRHTVAAYAPITAWPDGDNLTVWKRIGQFDTLRQCESQYRANQAASADIKSFRDIAAQELFDEGRPTRSDAELERRAGQIAKGFADQIADERCIASDPNNAR